MANVSRDYADQIAKDRGEAMDELERRNMSDKQEPHLRFGGAHAKEAFHEALRRYPGSKGALVWFWVASGLGICEPSPEALAAAEKWANENKGACHPDGGSDA